VAEIEQIVKGMDAEIKVLVYDEKGFTGLRYGMEKYYPTWKMEQDDPLVTLAERTFSDLFGKNPVTDKWTFSTNGVVINGIYKIPVIGFGPGNEVLAHAPDEKIPVSDLVAASAFYAALAQYFANYE
jgi:acetylornithine deacetylase/succinyl-diaminopimelate desuccinylase-like protein